MLIAFRAALTKSGNGVSVFQPRKPKWIHRVSRDRDGNVVAFCFQVVCFTDDITTRRRHDEVKQW